jgi:hypothetical protein
MYIYIKGTIVPRGMYKDHNIKFQGTLCYITVAHIYYRRAFLGISIISCDYETASLLDAYGNKRTARGIGAPGF